MSGTRTLALVPDRAAGPPGAASPPQVPAATPAAEAASRGRRLLHSKALLRLIRELITQIVLPGALPQALVGLRQSLGIGWLALVVAEQFNTNAGLGFMISQATQFSRNDVIFVALLVYCILGLLTDALVRLFERRALAWRRSFVAA